MAIALLVGCTAAHARDLAVALGGHAAEPGFLHGFARTLGRNALLHSETPQLGCATTKCRNGIYYNIYNN